MYSSSQSSGHPLPVFAFAFLFLTMSVTVTSFPSLPLPTRLVYQFPNETCELSLIQALRSGKSDIPEAGFLDGGATLSKADKTIILGDALLGVVWKLNVESGAYSVIISDPTMNPLPDAIFEVGIDGLKIFDSYMYFTNDNQGLVCRVPICSNGTATGKVEVLADLGTKSGLDDLTEDPQGRVWLTENPENLISVLFRNGTVVNAAGATGQSTVAGVTACLFGRETETEDTLYCTTCGGLDGPVNGTVTEGGKIVSIDTKGF